MRERDRRVVARRARSSGRSLSGEINQLIEKGLRDGELERAIKQATPRTILSVVQELQVNPDKGAPIAGAVERKLKEDAQQMDLFSERGAAR
jgi:hypothetical protein